MAVSPAFIGILMSGKTGAPPWLARFTTDLFDPTNVNVSIPHGTERHGRFQFTMSKVGQLRRIFMQYPTGGMNFGDSYKLTTTVNRMVSLDTASPVVDEVEWTQEVTQIVSSTPGEQRPSETLEVTINLAPGRYEIRNHITDLVVPGWQLVTSAAPPGRALATLNPSTGINGMSNRIISNVGDANTMIGVGAYTLQVESI